MENSFDSLAKLLGGATTRREALKRLGQFGGAAVLSLFGLGRLAPAATLCQMSCANICQGNKRCGCADCVNRCAAGCPTTAKMCYAGGHTCTCCGNQGSSCTCTLNPQEFCGIAPCGNNNLCVCLPRPGGGGSCFCVWFAYEGHL